MTSEVALSVVLLAAAGVLFHSFVTLISVDTGFESDARLVTVDLQLIEYTAQERAQFTEGVMGRLRATVPGVGAVLASSSLPFQFTGGEIIGRRSTISREGSAPLRVEYMPVTTEYFSGLGIAVLEGRELEAGDAEYDPVPVVIDETVSRVLFDGESPIGQVFETIGVSARVVGVAADVRFAALEQGPTPMMYLPWESFGPELYFMTLGIRTESPLEVVAPLVREAIWAEDPNLPVPEISTMRTRISRSVGEERFLSALLSSFAIVAGLITGAGLYGTLLYTVRQRQKELGIRVAIGAQRWDLVRMVLLEGGALALGGIALGLLVVWAAGDVLESYVFGIAPRDAGTIATVSFLLGGLALAACLAPAIRAGAAQPMATLRVE